MGEEEEEEEEEEEQEEEEEEKDEEKEGEEENEEDAVCGLNEDIVSDIGSVFTLPLGTCLQPLRFKLHSLAVRRRPFGPHVQHR